ncbi:MAG: hypothetical protein C5B50_12250, partial [Verrucomicrobia bacterium]
MQLNSFKITLVLTLLCGVGFIPVASAAVTYWDPQGTTGSNPYTGDLSGAWETASWSTSGAGTNNPVTWVENTAACFAIHTGNGTPAFTVTMNGNHNIAGAFDGVLAPNASHVSINGTGQWVLSAAEGFNASTSGDGVQGQLTINVPIVDGSYATGLPAAPTGQVVAEGNGQLFFNAGNTYRGGSNAPSFPYGNGGTLLGYYGSSWSGTINFNNSQSFGMGSIALMRGYSASFGTLAVEGASAITIPNTVDFSQSLSNAPFLNIVGNTAGVTFSGNWTLGNKAVNLGSGGAANNLVIISGPITGTGSITTFNPGILLFSGTNTYTGPTTIGAGTLALANSNPIGASTVSVSSGATLSNATTTVCAIGGPTALNSGASAAFTALGGASPLVGKISVAGDLTLNANTFVINVIGFALAPGVYRLMDCTGNLSGSANSAPTITGIPLVCGYSASIATTTGSGGHVDLTVVAVPATKTWNGSVSSDWFNPNNWTPIGVPACGDTINFSSGTINLSSPVTIGGQFNWTGGTLSGSPLTIATNAVLNITGGGTEYLENVLTNAGTVTMSGSGT